MRIAQISPLYESVPPTNYGGTERVVSYLTEELVRQGHEVTLFASGDSVTDARLIAPCPRSLRTDSQCVDQLAWHYTMLSQVSKLAEQFDVLHYHVDYLHLPFSASLRQPSLTTLHGRLDIPELPFIYRQYPRTNLVSISDSQRRPLPHLNWRGTIYHGLPLDLHTYREKTGDYLAFIGRISPEKRVDRAIEIAQRAGVPLKIAAKIDKADRDYYESIKHLMDQSDIEFVGEIGGAAKDEFLGNARALLFPIDWPEPFGLVMIEAMACGTPVIAWRRGSVPEVVTHGQSGYIVDTIDDAVKAVANLPHLRRRVCRDVFEDRFSARRMADDYLRVYQRLTSRSARENRLEVATPPMSFRRKERNGRSAAVVPN
jgi:glycosyltransferase involved in cell wall biosynthesis